LSNGLTVLGSSNRSDEISRKFIGEIALSCTDIEGMELIAEIGGVPPVCEAFRLPRIASIARPMNTQTHDFVTVDMRGLKAALVARAQTERVSLSVVVRRAVERELGQGGAADKPVVLTRTTVKLSLRLTGAEAEQLAAGARQAGLSRGAYLAGLLAGVPSLVDGSASRPDRLAALNASCAELSTLSRDLHHLTSLLRQGQVRAAMAYRETLDTLGVDVREHLAVAASLLAELRPARPARVALQRQSRAVA
jgi:hypothetical protein